MTAQLLTKNRSYLVPLFALSLLVVSGFQTTARIKWPDGKKAAIVLTYDDGLDSHLNIAVPQLDTFGFKGTFFLYGYLSENRFAAWKEVSEHGHELGNHSLFHPCKGNDSKPGSSRFLSENYDVPSMLREIEVMNKLLFAITGKQPASYAYPCSETMVGGVDYADSLKASGLLRQARTGGDRVIVTAYPDLNFYKIPGYSVRPGSVSSNLIGYAEDVLKQGGFGVYIFHGIGGDYLSLDAQEHLSLLKYLNEHRDEIWVTTFSEVMEYIHEKRND
ncbi:MAG: polysaccharide deacetylase family protein [Mangrovibacterium sp.]